MAPLKREKNKSIPPCVTKIKNVMAQQLQKKTKSAFHLTFA